MKPRQFVARKRWLLAITALGGFLRFYQIGGKGLWLDEAFSVWMGSQPMRETLSWVVRIDQHPPLYYLLLHFWMRLGDDPATVRALSALCGTLTIPVIYLLGRRLADGRTGLLAALLLAVSPFHVRFAQEARMYALLSLNASVALYAVTRLLAKVPGCRSPDTRSDDREAPNPKPKTVDWLTYVFFTAATLWTHNTAVFLPLAANLFALGLLVTRALSPPVPGTELGEHETLNSEPGTQWRQWLLAQLSVFLLWLPWLPAFVPQSVAVYREFWLPDPTWETVFGVVGAFASDFSPLPPWGILVVGILFAGLALLGVVYLRRRPARVAFLLVVFATPLVGEWLVSLRRPILYDRTLIWASFPLYLLMAAGLRRLRHWPRVLAAVLLVLAVNGLSLREYYVNFEKEQWDDAAELVAEHMQPNDLILFNTTWGQIPFDYYFHRLYNRPALERGVPADLLEWNVLEPKMTAGDVPRLRALLGEHERVWLVYSHDWYTDPEGLIPRVLEEELDPHSRCDFVGLQVRLYARR